LHCLPKGSRLAHNRLMYCHFHDRGMALWTAIRGDRYCQYSPHRRFAIAIAQYRTGLRHAETEIEKWRAETSAVKPTDPGPKIRKLSTRDWGGPGRSGETPKIRAELLRIAEPDPKHRQPVRAARGSMFRFARCRSVVARVCIEPACAASRQARDPERSSSGSVF
jgi:hypothetical protein